jgi:hypothetical protein
MNDTASQSKPTVHNETFQLPKAADDVYQDRALCREMKKYQFAGGFFIRFSDWQTWWSLTCRLQSIVDLRPADTEERTVRLLQETRERFRLEYATLEDH